METLLPETMLGATLFETVAASYNYWITIALMMLGLYTIVAKSNMIKTLIGMGIFQTTVYLLYLSPGKILGGTAPITAKEFEVYSNPLPHVLILTAIVVGLASLSFGLALSVRIFEAYGTIEEDEIVAMVDNEDKAEDAPASGRPAPVPGGGRAGVPAE